MVSLLASGTEIVCALGLADQLVGRSHECDYPPEIVDLPICSSPRLDPSQSSQEIHDRVTWLLEKALSIYEVDVAQLTRLRPSVIITQDMCRVCAVHMDDLQWALRRALGISPTVVTLSPHRLADIWDDVKRVAAALGVPEAGEELVVKMQARMALLSVRAHRAPERPSVACIEWIEPLMSAGNWMPELIMLAGGVSVFGVTGKRSPWISINDLVNADPDVILVAPCGFKLDQTEAELSRLTALPEWEDLRAVRNGRVHLADGNAYFHRSGPRLVDSLELLVGLLHPSAA